MLLARHSLPVLLLALVSGLAHAQQADPVGPGPRSEQATPASDPAPLLVGDAAPDIFIASWPHNGPASIERGSVTIVEFWATWCGPCVASIPHLSKIATDRKAEGVRVIAISVDDEIEPLTKFLMRRGKDMAYAVGHDDAGRSERAWMQAAGMRGIPASFVVNKDGVLAWRGHPMELESVLPAIIAGTHDISRARASDLRERELVRLRKAYHELVQSGERTKGVAMLRDALAKDATLGVALAPLLYDLLASELRDVKSANAFASEQLATPVNDDPDALNALAWTIAEARDAKGRDLALAQSIAERALALRENDPAILDTLAAVRFERGDRAGAVEAQQRAVELEKEEGTREAYEDTLRRYRRSLKAQGK